MSIPALGPKKVRKLSALTGLDLTAAFSGDGTVAYGITDDHRHVTIQRRTGEYVVEEPGSYYCWTSCPHDDTARSIRHGA